MTKKQALLQMLMTIRQRGRLPAEYQEVEYIENTGGSFIQTTIVPTIDTNCEIDFEVASNDNNCNVIMGTANTGSGVPGYIIGCDPWTAQQSSRNIWIRVNNVSGQDLGAYSYSQQRNKIAYKNKQVFINDVPQTLNRQPSLTTALVNPIAIFVRMQAGGYIPFSGNVKLGKLYSCKFWGDVNAELVPCYRKSDNEIGLYDTINNVFYTNAGTGTFLKGANI